MTDKPNCYKCKFRGDVPGSGHSSCHHPATKEVHENTMLALMSALGGGHIPPIETAGIHVKGNPHGISQGWFGWPMNFDPTWLEECDGFSAKDEEKE